MHPQTGDSASQSPFGKSTAVITVSDQHPPGKKQKLPIKAPSSGPVQLTRVAHASRCQVVLNLWSKFVPLFSVVSPMLANIECSVYASDHSARFLDQFAATALVKYLTAILAWYQICVDMHVDPWTLSDSQLADVICASSLARRANGEGPKHSMTLKALRWAHKRLQIACLACVFEPICNSFHTQKTLGDRRESLPFSLFILCQWERRLLSSNCSEFEVIVLGSFLFLVWSGLRFSDMQRSNLSSWQFTLDELRGISWRTKTAANVSFGLISKGFLSWGTHSWLLKWLSVLDELHSRSLSDSVVVLRRHRRRLFEHSSSHTQFLKIASTWMTIANAILDVHCSAFHSHVVFLIPSLCHCCCLCLQKICQGHWSTITSKYVGIRQSNRIESNNPALRKRQRKIIII